MNILAFVDTHEDPGAFARLRRVIAQHDVDLAVCAGDFTIFGRKTGDMLREMDEFGVPVVLIHGNHEDEDEVTAALEGCENIHWAHDTCVDLLGVRFIGFGGHGFRRREPGLEALEERLAPRFTPRTIVVSHAPPFGTAMDQPMSGWHVGNESLTDLVVRRNPMLVICGHIHQCFHAHDTIRRTKVINPGPDGELIEVIDDRRP